MQLASGGPWINCVMIESALMARFPWGGLEVSQEPE